MVQGLKNIWVIGVEIVDKIIDRINYQMIALYYQKKQQIGIGKKKIYFI